MPKQFSWPHPSDAMNAVAQLSAPGATVVPLPSNPRQSAHQVGQLWLSRVKRAAGGPMTPSGCPGIPPGEALFSRTQNPAEE